MTYHLWVSFSWHGTWLQNRLSQVHSLTLDVAMLLASLYRTEGSYTPRWKPNIYAILLPISCRSVQQCFWESIAKLVDGFWILATLFAAFRNCRSVRSNFTAQTHLCFPPGNDSVNLETSEGKLGKYHTWVGRQKWDGQKSPKSVSRGLRMSYQKRAADDSKPTDAHTSDIHKNRCILLHKNCTSRLHSGELRRVSIHMSAAANPLWTIAIR